MNGMPEGISDYLDIPPKLPCPYCKARPRVEYLSIGNGMKFRLYCNGVNHVIRSLPMESMGAAVRDWNYTVGVETKEDRI